MFTPNTTYYNIPSRYTAQFGVMLYGMFENKKHKSEIVQVD
jgi:hypothetical protein